MTKNLNRRTVLKGLAGSVAAATTVTTVVALESTQSTPPTLRKKVLMGIYTPFLDGGVKGEPQYLIGYADEGIARAQYYSKDIPK